MRFATFCVLICITVDVSTQQGILCVYSPTTFGKESVSPQGKTLFKPGETLEITCAEKYWIFSAPTKSKICTCREDGTWNTEPVCQEKRCEVPRESSLYYPERYFTRTNLGDEVNYHCDRSCTKAAEYATCTEHGWEPIPLCIEPRCRTPNIPNGEIVEGEKEHYDIFSTVKYRCREGFTPAEPVQIQCNYILRWTGIKPCTAISKCGPPPVMRHRFADTLDIPKDEYESGEKVEYQCYSKYIMANSPYMNCTDGEWTGKITCLKPCSVSVEMLEERNIELMVGGLKEIFVPHDDHITFVCQKPKKFVGKIHPRLKCTNGVMVLPECA